MKGKSIIPTIIGSMLLGAFAVGLSSCDKKATLIHEYALEGEINNIDFDVSISDVTFKATTDGTKKVVFQETKRMYHTYNVSEGKLQIGFKDERTWNEKIFSFNDLKVDLYLPSAFYGDLTGKSSTGDISIPSDFSFNNINIELSTGDINLTCNATESIVLKSSTGKMSLNKLYAKNVTLTSDTGNAELNEVTVYEKITIKRSTGNIKMNSVRAHDYESQSSTGQVNFKDVLIYNHIQIQTSTGDVKLEDSDASTLKIKTSTGDVKGTLLTSKIFYAKSDTGKIDVPKSTEGGMCEIETSTGDISFTIKA